MLWLFDKLQSWFFKFKLWTKKQQNLGQPSSGKCKARSKYSFLAINNTSLRFASAGALLFCLHSSSSACSESRARVTLKRIMWGCFCISLGPLRHGLTVAGQSLSNQVSSGGVLQQIVLFWLHFISLSRAVILVSRALFYVFLSVTQLFCLSNSLYPLSLSLSHFQYLCLFFSLLSLTHLVTKLIRLTSSLFPFLSPSLLLSLYPSSFLLSLFFSLSLSYQLIHFIRLKSSLSLSLSLSLSGCLKPSSSESNSATYL